MKFWSDRSQQKHTDQKKRKNRNKWIYAAAAVVGLAVVIYFFLQTKNETSAPIITRTTGSNSIAAPNISSDGNWITYCDTDAKGIRNIYVAHASGGSKRKVTDYTNEVQVRINNPYFSPDASQIVYEKDYEVHIVPVMGGTSHKVNNRGFLPKWSTDGKHIAFLRFSEDMLVTKLFTIHPDGTEEKLLTEVKNVFASQIFYAFEWSPDSKRMALLRSFKSDTDGEYTEICIREIESGVEQQITFDKKFINDICWVGGGEIIFSSTRGGDSDLWSIPENGGTAKQITLGTGNESSISASKDARRLVYLNTTASANLWSLELSNKRLTQITFEDDLLFATIYSHDGSKLTYMRMIIGSSKDEIILCNEDGSDPVKIVPQLGENKTWGQCTPVGWSADDKSIYLRSWQIDTVRAENSPMLYCFFIYDIETQKTRKAGDGELLSISNDGKYILYTPIHPYYSEQNIFLALASNPSDKIKEFVHHDYRISFSWDSKNVITQDEKGVWFTPVDGEKKRLLKTPKSFRVYSSMPGDSMLIGVIEKEKGEFVIVTIDIFNNSIKEIIKVPPGAQTGMVHPNGKTLGILIFEEKSRVVVLDNFR